MIKDTNTIAKKGDSVKFIDFGSNDTYIIRWS